MGIINWARAIASPPFYTRPPSKGLKLKGWLYEQRGHEELLDRYGIFRYIPGQWFAYRRSPKKLLFCQTDGLLFTPEQQKVLIVEFKYKHTIGAYKQLEEKYVPVVRMLLPEWEISTVEIVKWYDPSTSFPVAVSLKKDILQTKPNEFGVHIFNPR